MESWRRVFRTAILPLINRNTLEQIATALRDDDPRLVQGQTTVPPVVSGLSDWPCQGGCLIGFAGMVEGLRSVGEINDFFAEMCYRIDERLGEPAGCRWFLNWFDETPRAVVRRELYDEITVALRTEAVA